MFCLSMKNGVIEQGNSAQVVTIQHMSGEGNLKINKQGLNLQNLSGWVSKGHVFNFSAGSGYQVLLFRPPGNQIWPQKNAWAWGRSPVIRMWSPICIWKTPKRHKSLCGSGLKQNTIMKGALQLPENSFHNYLMAVQRAREKLTGFVHNKTNLKYGESGILKGPNYGSIKGWLFKHISPMFRQL